MSGKLVVAGLMLAGVLGGCSSPPRGDSGGRVPIGDSTRAEEGSRLVTTQEMSEFQDETAQRFAEDFMELDEFSQYRSSIVFGDIVNKTGIVSTSDFEAILNGLRNSLMKSKVLRNKVGWYESRARWEDLRKKELGSGGDVLQEGGTAARKFDPEHTYFLNGEMIRISRGGDEMQMYSLTLNLMKASTSEIVINNTYESKRIVK